MKKNPLQKAHKRRSKPTLSEWTEKWFTNGWGSELINWLFAALSVTGIVITLSIHNGRPLPDWPFGITLNTLISVLATIGEMAMMQPVTECISQLKWLWFTRPRPLEEFDMLDAASRSRMGSLKLFLKLRRGGLHLVSLGAAIGIIGLAFGPFTQQVLTYPSRLGAAGFATTPGVFNYINSDSSPLNASMFAAVGNGFSNSHASLSTVLTSCKTEYCTWSSYPSLGICASVVDISENLTPNFCDGTELNETNPSEGASQPVFDVPCFNYTLKSDGNSSNISFTSMMNSSITSVTTQLFEGPQDFVQSGTTLLDFYVLHQPLISANSEMAIALECRLEFCVQMYETTVYPSNTTTIVTSTELFTPSKRPDDQFMEITTDGVDFTITRNTSAFISSYIWQIFVGWCHTFVGQNQTSSIECNTTGAQAFGSAINQQSGLASDMKLAVESVLNNTAITMTNAMRQGAGGFGSVRPVNGTAYTTETYIHADYPWLALPIGLILLVLIFLLATMSKSHKAKIQNWKSSSQSVLQGLDHTLHGELGDLYAMDELKGISRGLQVKVAMREDGSWSLVRV